MKIKTLGSTSLKISEIGIGTWALGGADWEYSWGKQDDQTSINTLLKAFEVGINWVDTAPVYGLGHSEIIVGKAIKSWKDKIIIATKCGLLADSKRKVYSSLKKESIIKEAELSLKRLNIEIIDLYQIHWPKPANEIEEAFSALIELKKQGKIKYAGVSNFSVKQMEMAKKHGLISSLQPPYNIINRRIEDDIIEYCSKNNIGLITYSPLQNGLLTGKFSQDKINSLSKDDWRKTKSVHFKEPELKSNLKLIEQLKKFAENHGYKVTDLAIAWILSNKKITSIILGARTPAQIEKNVSACKWHLNEKEKANIENIYHGYKQELKNQFLS